MLWNNKKRGSGLFVCVGATLSKVLKETGQRLTDQQTDRSCHLVQFLSLLGNEGEMFSANCNQLMLLSSLCCFRVNIVNALTAKCKKICLICGGSFIYLFIFEIFFFNCDSPGVVQCVSDTVDFWCVPWLIFSRPNPPGTAACLCCETLWFTNQALMMWQKARKSSSRNRSYRYSLVWLHWCELTGFRTPQSRLLQAVDLFAAHWLV